MNDDQVSKIKSVREEAEDAFWAVVARRYPECTTGDFPIDLTFEMRLAMERWIKFWVEENSPDDASEPLD